MNFIALDVETANADFASICQIGLVEFVDGKPVKQLHWLINPEDYFDPFNTSLHGIDERTVRDASPWRVLHKPIKEFLDKKIIIHHMPFDMLSLRRVSEKYGLPTIECRWLDSARVARRAWEKYSQRGYALANLAADFGIQFRHHRADEDARVAGEVVVRAIQETGISLEDWLIKAYKKTHANTRVAKTGNPDGPLYGETIVFTGALSMPRKQAAATAAKMGCNVGDNVTLETTILVVGDQDITKLAGKDKSTKHQKAEKLISTGQPIRIIGESDFSRLVNL